MERDIAWIGLFAALIAVLGLIPPVMLGFGVPITAQSLGVMLCGTVLGAKRGGLAALLFVALVLMGLPILSGGRGGIGVLASPTAGFVIGFPIAAFVTGLIMQFWQNGRLAIIAASAAIIGGVGALYICGIAGLAMMLEKSLDEAALLAIAFIPGDLVKAVIAGMLTAAIAQARPEPLPSRQHIIQPVPPSVFK